MVSGTNTENGLTTSTVSPCEMLSLVVKVNSVMYINCGKCIYRCAEVKRMIKKKL